MSVAQQLAETRQAIECAELSANRPADSVRLVAVSKTHPAEAVLEAVAAGQTVFGENKPQEMAAKYPAAPLAEWHLIGHLQTNKVKLIAPFVALIHSLDSEKLMAEIDRQAKANNRTIDCLVQINISDEEAKSGLDEAEAEHLFRSASNYPNVRIVGLMGMAAFTDDRVLIRSQFNRLAEAARLFKVYENDQIQMRELSMGMSGDFDLAIAAGATLVRIGSAIFGAR